MPKAKKSLTIGLVIDTDLDKPDGVQQYVRTLARWLSRQGHTVHYLAGHASSSSLDGLPVHTLARNINVRANRNRMSIPLWAKRAKIRDLLRKIDFDILHVQAPYHPLMAGYVITQAPRKTGIVVTFHVATAQRMLLLGYRLLSTLQAKSNRCVDAWISVSDAAQKLLKSATGIDSIIIPNAVSIETFAAGTPQKDLRGNAFTIVFLGRLVERKGAQHLLRALKIIVDEELIRKKVHVHVCSDGPMREELEHYVDANGLRDIVTFHGYIDESRKPDFLASADIAIYPATGGESFGIVLIEAMAANAQVVLAGNNEGYAGVMKGSKQLFTPTNHPALARKIAAYANNAAARREARAWQAKRVREFDINVVGPQILETYDNTLAN